MRGHDDDIDPCVKLCEVGDVLFRVGRNKIYKVVISEIKQYPHYVYRDTDRSFIF